MPPTSLMLVGGFLGAGKTTLLWQAARGLAEAGRRAGLITNDQAPQLVDTGLLQGAGFTVQEIAGGCFCCRFNELIGASQELVRALQPDILIAEPVGSCTDLSATVIQPLKELFAADFRLLPFSVLVDPDRLAEALDPRVKSPLHASARYILRKQLEEADIILLNKIDLLSAEDRDDLSYSLHERFSDTPVFEISALTGEGIDEWLAAVLAAGPAGQRIVEVDYDTYAEGEAVLGWLNATVRLDGMAVDWQDFCTRLLTGLQQGVIQQGREIAHLKLLLATSSGSLIGNLTCVAGIPAIRGQVAGSPTHAELVLNARVEMAPEELQALVEQVIYDVAGASIAVTFETIESLSPGRPQPTHRYIEVVG